MTEQDRLADIGTRHRQAGADLDKRVWDTAAECNFRLGLERAAVIAEGMFTAASTIAGQPGDMIAAAIRAEAAKEPTP